MARVDKQPKKPATREQYAQIKNVKEKKKHGFFYKFFVTVFLLLVIGIIGGGSLFAFYAKDAPNITRAKLISNNSSTIYDDKGTVIKTLGDENREYITSDKIPKRMKDAVVSIEDRRFYSHIGVDPIRIVGAAFANVTGSSLGLQGGSTLTQQLVKLSVFSTKKSDQTIERKAQEAWLALKVEHEYSKDEILEFYINKVYLDNGVYGMGTAAEYYYGKPLKKLDLAQTALIAGIPQQPAGYDPYVNPDKATTRRNIVLDAMVEAKKITKSESDAAKSEDIATGLVDQTQSQAKDVNNAIVDAYIKETISEVQNKLGLDPYTDGLKIYTNLNMDQQKNLYNVVNTNDYVNFPNDEMQTAATMTDATNGNVIAMIGGRKTENVQLGLNRAVQNTRSNGSTMKPLMDYGPAIEYENWSTAQPMLDTKYVYPGTNIQLFDWDMKYDGAMTMRTALKNSRNVPAIRTLETIGLPKAQEFLKGLGISFKDGLEIQNGIGAPLSTLQESAAYAAFANGGTYYQPTFVRKIVTSDGTSKDFTGTSNRAMKSSTAYMITDMLKDVIKSGSGTSAQIPNVFQAGKTGTTNYSDQEKAANPALAGLAKDSWFAGYTKKYSVAVWTGYDKPNEHGVNMTEQTVAAKVYRSIMKYAVDTTGDNTDWTMPDSVVAATVGGVRQLYVAGTQPSGGRGASSKTPATTVEDDEEDEMPEPDADGFVNSQGSGKSSSSSHSSVVSNSSSSRETESSSESSSSESSTSGGNGTP